MSLARLHFFAARFIWGIENPNPRLRCLPTDSDFGANRSEEAVNAYGAMVGGVAEEFLQRVRASNLRDGLLLRAAPTEPLPLRQMPRF